MYDRDLIPPHDDQLERVALAAIIQRPDVLSKLAELFSPWIFRNKFHKDVAGVIQSRHQHGRVIDEIILRQELLALRHSNDTEYDLRQITRQVVSSAYLESYLVALHDLADRRRILEVAYDLSESGTPITKAGLSKYEKAKSVPNQSFLMALAKRLGVKPSYFVTESSCSIQWHAFRKQVKLPKRIQEHVKASAEREIEAHLWLVSVLDPNAQPKFPKPVSVADFAEVEGAATLFQDGPGTIDILGV